MTSFTGKPFDAIASRVEGCDYLCDVVEMVSPHETPLLDGVGDSRAWATDSKGQEFSEMVTVSGDLCTDGVECEFSYRVINRTRELMRQLEQSVISGKGGNGNILGVLEREETNRIDADGEALCADLVGMLASLLPLECAPRRALVVGGYQYRTLRCLSEFAETRSGGNLRKSFATESGDVEVILSRWMPRDKALLIDLDGVHVSAEEDKCFRAVELPTNGDYRRARVTGTYSLDVDSGAVVLEGLASE